MAVKLRLKRMGSKQKPFYRIVAADSRSPRDGRFIETVGTYNPIVKENNVTVDEEKAIKWLNNGAQLPWICVNFDTDVNAKIAFTYEGKKDVYPWLDKIFGTGEGHKSWGLASIPAEFIGDNSISDFDPSKFEIKLVIQIS